VTPETNVNVANLFAQLLLDVDINPSEDLESTIRNCEIDFNLTNKRRLISTIMEVENSTVSRIENDYTVSVRLKDSVYAFTPRRFAHAEKRDPSNNR